VERGAFSRLRRERGWPRLFGAALLARVSNEMFAVAVLLYVVDRSHDTALGALTVAAVTFPSLVSGPLLGRTLDRMRRPARLLAADQAVMAVALVALIALVEAGSPWAALAPALLAGVTFPLSTAGFTTLLPSLVRPSLLPAANAVEASTYGTALVVGPALASVLALGADPLAAVAVQVGLKLVALALILTVPVAARAPRGVEAGGIRAGLRAIRDAPALLAVTVGSSVALAGRGTLVVGFPLFAGDLLDLDRAVAGFLWAALAAGSIAGTLGLARVLHRRPPALVAVGAVGLGGAIMLSWPLATTLPLALALVALAGFALGPGLSGQIGARQQLAPGEVQGQVFMTAASLKVASFAVGAALAAALAAGGAEPVLLAAAVLHVAGFLAGALLLRRREPASLPAGAR